MLELLIMLVLVLGVCAIFFAVYGRSRAPAAPEKEPVRLSVVQDRAAKCGNCQHFDLAEGQAQMRKAAPIFSAMVAPFVSPTDYATKVTEVQMNKEGILENGAEVPRAAIPESCDWSRFGYCEKHSERLWEGTTRANRVNNMADLTPGGVDCFEPRVLS